ncbi:universal stress protein [Spirosoma pollinicola]|uniref:Universal stress protein n=1 Tax=Spirosoma pollinicola TaxID=2057025 RepID=A0A2K8Z336_9BACT|nr:universal stress protein [Spirosoma pollinicola]AUD04275.1 universal stress protein [Spirosoma pollinicola]
MYKILLLTDFSAASRHALSFAQTLFADTATDFSLTNAFPFEPEMSYGGAFWLEEEQQETRKSLHHLKETMTQQPISSLHTYRTSIILGEPVQAVERLLEQEHFDLIVLGTTGAGRSSLFGSVATGMIRQVTTNVLVVPASVSIGPIEQIVLATDYRSVNHAESLVMLKEVACRKAAMVTLLTIKNAEEPVVVPTEISRQSVFNALANVQTESFEMHDDDVLHGINTFLDTHTVDMLVMLPHHTGLFDVLRNKSVSRAVAYHPRVPLLTLYDAKNKVKGVSEPVNTYPVVSGL